MDGFEAARLRALLSALRDDIKPELTSPNARQRADIMDMLLTRLSVEAELGPLPAPGADPQTLEEIAAFVREEGKHRNAMEDAVASAAVTPVRQGSGTELSIPPERFTDYLRRRFPGDPDIRCTSLVTVPGGRSKGTILVEVEGASTPSSIVLRRDFVVSVTGTSVVDEYPIIRAAYAAGVPAPPPLWLEEDREALGGQFIAFERVAGKAQGTLFTTEATKGVLLDFAAALARMHQIDIDQAGIADQLEFGRADNAVRATLDGLWHRYQTRAPKIPLLDAGFTYLRLMLDAVGARRALVHGDASMHNLMGEGDRLTALLDWEFAHAGDPAEDLTFAKPLVEETMPWPEFMAAYEAAGGEAISPERMTFFTVYRTLQLAVFAAGARFMFEAGKDQDLRLATISYNSVPRHLRALANNLTAATAGN